MDITFSIDWGIWAQSTNSAIDTEQHHKAAAHMKAFTTVVDLIQG